MNKPTILDFPSSGLRVSFSPNHRNFTIESHELDTFIVHHFIGSSELMGNLMGISSLEDRGLRREIEMQVNTNCGSRPRTVWLQSGYHDIAKRDGSSRTKSTDQNILHAIAWAETLAPSRAWLSRHVAFKESEILNVTGFENRVSQLLLNRNSSWDYIDYRVAWACENDSNWHFPVHLGAIALYSNSSYAHAYLSMLRTQVALLSVPEQVERTLMVCFTHGGWNNQREVLMIAAETAKLLNRTLVVPTSFRGNKHDEAIALRDSINVPLLREYVKVTVKDAPVEQGAVLYTPNPRCQFKSRAWVDQLRNETQDHDEVYLRADWGYFDSLFRYNADVSTSRNPPLPSIWKFIAFPPDVLECSSGLIRLILEECTNVHAVHMRLGDRWPYPLFNCSEMSSFRTATNGRHQECVHERTGAALTMEEVFIHDVRPENGSCLYMATNKPEDPVAIEFNGNLSLKTGMRVFTYESVKPYLTDKCHAMDSVISIFEQAIAQSVPGRYVATFPSSWDEMVLNARAQLGKQGAEKDLSILNDKASNMIQYFRATNGPGGPCVKKSVQGT